MSEDIKKGLLGIVVDETTVSQVMPDINSLTYRGYAVQDLCKKSSFEEVAYLILNKELPNKTQLNKFKKQLEKNRNITINLRDIIKHMPKKSHPMDVARTVVSIMGLEDKETNSNSPAANIRKAIRIFAKTPTAVAAFFRARKGKNVIPPKKKLTFSENFFYMCFYFMWFISCANPIESFSCFQIWEVSLQVTSQPKWLSHFLKMLLR